MSPVSDLMWFYFISFFSPLLAWLFLGVDFFFSSSWHWHALSTSSIRQASHPCSRFSSNDGLNKQVGSPQGPLFLVDVNVLYPVSHLRMNFPSRTHEQKSGTSNL